MGYLVVTVVVAALVVLVTFGSFGQLAKVEVRAVWLLLAGLGVQIVVTFAGIPRHLYDSVGFGLIMFSYVLILAFCFMNIGIRGIGVITVGIACNALVIGLNQGMPTRDQPITTASGRHIRRPITPDVKHRAERSSDLLPFLSDIIWLPKPLDEETVSFGDLILAVGICEFAYYASRRRYTRGNGLPADADTGDDETRATDEPAAPDAATTTDAPDAAPDPVDGVSISEGEVPDGEVPDGEVPDGEGAVTADAQRTGSRAPRRSRTRSRAPSTRPS